MVLRRSTQVRRIKQDLIKDLEAQNEARLRAGLPLLKVKTRKCVACGSLFESLEARVCGCTSEKRSQITSFMGMDAIVGY